ncbi:MAG: RluA family pseudouridine synthase [Spirochaetaceae bacterium]|nr:RluA family pseudouridine synthase [Spirochaetaceae bacterium]
MKNLQILYQDKYLIVINKPSGLLSVNYEGFKGKSALSLIENMMYKRGIYSKTHRPFPVHRLDKDTSGVMMFALSQEMQQKIMNTWHKMILERTYIAVAENPLNQKYYLTEKSGIIDDKITYNKKHIGYISKNNETTDGIVAKTHYTILNEGKHYSLFKLNLDTGRKNQIRIHLSNKKYPIAGDKNYHAKTNPFGRLALHARTLSFIHPVTKEKLTFEIPEDSTWEKLVTNNNIKS